MGAELEWRVGSGMGGLRTYIWVVARVRVWILESALHSMLKLQNFYDTQLKDLKKGANTLKTQSGKLKKWVDGQRLRNFPSTESIHAAVKESMLDLAAISKHVKDQGSAILTHAVRVHATTCVVGCIYYNAFAGRSGEWQMLQRKDVEMAIAKNMGHIICDKHKTAHVYGALAKPLPPGNAKAFQVPRAPTQVYMLFFFAVCVCVCLHNHGMWGRGPGWGLEVLFSFVDTCILFGFSCHAMCLSALSAFCWKTFPESPPPSGNHHGAGAAKHITGAL